jgi:hypothetical protein
VGDYERHAKGFAQENSELSRNTAQVAGRVVIAVAAIVALTLAVFIVRETVDYPGHVELGDDSEGSRSRGGLCGHCVHDDFLSVTKIQTPGIAH